MTASTRRALIGAALISLALTAILLLLSSGSDALETPVRPVARVLSVPPTAEPLVPTALPAFRNTVTPRPSLTPLAPPAARSSPTPIESQTTRPSPAPAALPAPQPTAAAQAAPVTDALPLALASGPERARVGAALALGKLSDYDWGEAVPGWYLSWRVDPAPPQPGSTRFAQMVRLKGDSFYPDLTAIRSAAQANPGALWLLGNEPDVKWQDNIIPEQYAETYHTLYRAIKAADPAAQIAIGGVSQPTPLRLVYLDRVLAAYRMQFGAEMPVDVWNVHAFVLREERGSWGVDIPPGMSEERGRLYEIADHTDREIFRQQIVDFRRWMAERGQRDKPLIVTEYGVLMPASYGFPPDVVANFLVATFDFFLTARDPELGCPADDGRLVQAFNWFSIADKVYPTSNLFDPETHAVTPVGEVFKAYVSALR